MGTMLQGYDLTLDDFDQLEGCNEILNRDPTRRRPGHPRRLLRRRGRRVETNTFGTNLSALGEYDIADRIAELAEAAARIARESADAHSTADRPRWVLGSVGPGTKLPTLGHVGFAALRDAYQPQVEGMLAGGIDAVLIETSQDLLQTKAADAGRQAGAGGRGARPAGDRARHGRDHRHHAAGLRDRRRADRAGAAGHRPDRAELRHRPGRDERAPAAPVAARPDRGQLHAERRACRS